MLYFCDECGQLMFPDKINGELLLRCKCGVIKPLYKDNFSAYKITTPIKHSYQKENIYRSFCGKKFMSSTELIRHTKTCQKCIDNDYLNQIVKKRKKEEEKRDKKRKLKLLKEKKDRTRNEVMKRKFIQKNKIIYHCVCGKQIIEKFYQNENLFSKHWNTHQYPLKYNRILKRVENAINSHWYIKLSNNQHQYKEVIDLFKLTITIIIHPKKFETGVYLDLQRFQYF